MARYGPFRDPDSILTVEFDKRSGRGSREFDCPYEARRFYVSKFKEGKNPKLKSVKEVSIDHRS